MIRNNLGVYHKFFNYLFREKYKTLKTMSNSTRAILANISRIRNIEIERYFYNNFKQKFNENKQKYLNSGCRFLLGATIFSFAEDKITDEEIQEHFKEFYGKDCDQDIEKIIEAESVTDILDVEIKLENPQNMFFNGKRLRSNHNLKRNEYNSYQMNKSSKRLSAEDPVNFIDSSWTQLIESKSVKLWRRPLQSNGKLFEYRLCGSFSDISARDFFFVQTDIDYRKSWDDLVVDLRVLSTDDNTKTETIRWVTHYPYPMNDREYIFKRRFIRHDTQETAIIVSKSINYNSSKFNSSSSKNVKVHDYKSLMYIQAHNRFEDNGIDYFLIYYDDPKTSFPSAAVNWMSTAGIPAFMDKVHKAALKLQEIRHLTIEESPPEENSDMIEDDKTSDNGSTELPKESLFSYFTNALFSFDFNFNKSKTVVNNVYNVQKSQ